MDQGECIASQEDESEEIAPQENDGQPEGQAEGQALAREG
jgi:hypothetical protein